MWLLHTDMSVQRLHLYFRYTLLRKYFNLSVKNIYMQKIFLYFFTCRDINNITHWTTKSTHLLWSKMLSLLLKHFNSKLFCLLAQEFWKYIHFRPFITPLLSAAVEISLKPWSLTMRFHLIVNSHDFREISTTTESRGVMKGPQCIYIITGLERFLVQCVIY